MPATTTPAPAGAGARRGPLILLDGMSLAFRAYFALPDTLKTSAGVTTNAVHGFASMVLNLVRDHHPVGLAVAFDLPGGTFRDEIVDDYKGGRDETPADLPPQFDMIRDVLESLAIPVVEAEGFEADDVLATLASEARDRGHPVIIVTGDRDSYQLVEDPYIRVLYNRRGVSDYALYDEAGIEERTGVLPPEVPAAGRPARRPVGQPARGARGGGEDGGQAHQRVRRPRHALRPPRRPLPEAPPEPGRARRPGAEERRGDPAGARRPAGRRRRRPGPRRVGPRGGPRRLRLAGDEGGLDPVRVGHA